MTALNRKTLATWTLRAALMLAGFEFGRGLALLHRGDGILPAVFSPTLESCCTLATSIAPVLA